jgi:hypothetical protein
MKYTTILIIFLTVFINPIFTMEEEHSKNIKAGHLLTEYSKKLGHFKGLSFIPSSKLVEIKPQQNYSQEKYPLSHKYPAHLLPNHYGKHKFRNNTEKCYFAKCYFTELEKMFRESSNKIEIEDGKIKSPFFKECVFSRSLLPNELEAKVITKMYVSGLTNLPICYSNYDEFKIKTNNGDNKNDSELEKNYKKIEAIYNWRHYMYKHMEIEKTYQDKLEKCENF